MVALGADLRAPGARRVFIILGEKLSRPVAAATRSDRVNAAGAGWCARDEGSRRRPDAQREMMVLTLELSNNYQKKGVISRTWHI